MEFHFHPMEEELGFTHFAVFSTYEPTRYKHVKRGTHYTVLSVDDYRLQEFSLEGSLHELVHKGVQVVAEFQFAGGEPDESGRPSKYAGPVVLYCGDDGKHWVRPKFEFFDGRFKKVEQ